nr:hypothetical protein [uncultured Dyadobacter sp.]
MKSLALIMAIALAMCSCNNLNDLRPVDPATVIPEATVKVVKGKFPKAEDLVFKPILQDKIWEVKLKSEADRYTSLVDNGKMWETFKVSADGVPSALQESLQKTALGNGTLSAPATGFFAASTKNKLMYSFRGENYSFEWSGVNPGSNSWASFDPALYRITTFDKSDLPAFVSDTMKVIPNMNFVTAQTWVRLDYTKLYYVIGSTWDGTKSERVSMLFDEKGKLRWSSTAFTEPGVTGATSNLPTVPAQIQQYVAGLTELTGFEYERKLVSNYRGLTSYYIRLAAGAGRCELYFDQDFNVLNKKYAVTLY